MKPDSSLFDRLHHGLCTAVERDGVLCFNLIMCKGLCWKHYSRVRKNGSVNIPKKTIKRCRFIDCANPYSAKGLCRSHYLKSLRRRSDNKIKCIVENCNKYNDGSKYCSMHRARISRYGCIEGSGKKRGNYLIGTLNLGKKEYRKCISKGCERDSNDFSIVLGLCPKHYMRWRKYGDYNIESKEQFLNGQRQVCSIPGRVGQRDTSIQSHNALPR